MPTSPHDKTTWPTVRAYLVHVYTALGIVCSFVATAELFAEQPDARIVFAWLAAAVAIDASDGPLARHWQIKRWAQSIEGRTIDDIVDYFTFTFVPLLLVWRMDWLPAPASVWICLALVASLLGFANVAAKQDGSGFFLGFPSYWNIVAYYVGLAQGHVPSYWGAIALVVLAVLTVLPVRFIYPNLAPPPWRGMVLGGALVWFGLLVAMLPAYPSAPGWLVGVSLVYPAFYVGLSVYLDIKERRRAE